MRKAVLIILAIICLIFLIFKWFDASFSAKEVVGTYVNKNFSSPICCVEAPHVPDTLTLNPDKTFYSGFYGHGTYTLDVGVMITEIKFSYFDGKMPAGMQTYFTKSATGTPRIVLNVDLNHYYEKVK